jgi:hypothetical protein
MEQIVYSVQTFFNRDFALKTKLESVSQFSLHSVEYGRKTSFLGGAKPGIDIAMLPLEVGGVISHALCYSVIQIWVSSNRPRGATFSISANYMPSVSLQ